MSMEEASSDEVEEIRRAMSLAKARRQAAISIKSLTSEKKKSTEDLQFVNDKQEEELRLLREQLASQDLIIKENRHNMDVQRRDIQSLREQMDFQNSVYKKNVEEITELHRKSEERLYAIESQITLECEDIRSLLNAIESKCNKDNMGACAYSITRLVEALKCSTATLALLPAQKSYSVIASAAELLGSSSATAVFTTKSPPQISSSSNSSSSSSPNNNINNINNKYKKTTPISPSSSSSSPSRLQSIPHQNRSISPMKPTVRIYRKNDAESALSDICEQLENENKRLEKMLESTLKDLEELKKSSTSHQLIPHYRLAIIRSKKEARRFNNLYHEELNNNKQLRDQLSYSFEELRKVTELMCSLESENNNNNNNHSSHRNKYRSSNIYSNGNNYSSSNNHGHGSAKRHHQSHKGVAGGLSFDFDADAKERTDDDYDVDVGEDEEENLADFVKETIRTEAALQTELDRTGATINSLSKKLKEEAVKQAKAIIRNNILDFENEQF